MRLILKSWGGFTGPAGAVTRTVDVDALPPDMRKRALALVEAARPFEQAEKAVLAAPRPWDFTYLLEVQDGTQKKRIQLHLDAVDRHLRALVEWIEQTIEPEGAVEAHPGH
jgi:emfourin